MRNGFLHVSNYRAVNEPSQLSLWVNQSKPSHKQVGTSEDLNWVQVQVWLDKWTPVRVLCYPMYLFRYSSAYPYLVLSANTPRTEPNQLVFTTRERYPYHENRDTSDRWIDDKRVTNLLYDWKSKEHGPSLLRHPSLYEAMCDG